MMPDAIDAIPVRAGQQIPLALTELAQRVASELGQHYQDMARIQQEIDARRHDGGAQNMPDMGIEIITEVAAVRERLDELSFFARNSIHALQPAARSDAVARDAAQRPDNRSLRRGLQIQVVTDAGLPGEQGALSVRVSPTPLSGRLIIIDSAVAVATLEDPHMPGAAMVVRQPTLLRALQVQFDTAWAEASGNRSDDLPTPAERQLLQLLLDGGTDDSIARVLGLSDRQVRRRTARLLERLGALNRFAAGAAAVRRGWL